MDTTPFVVFSAPHVVALLATAAGALLLVRLYGSPGISPQVKRAADWTMAAILVVSVFMDPLLTWLRNRSDPVVSEKLLRENSLPLHLCDIVSILLAWALISRRQRFAELGYVWGLAGTLQGLITPGVKYDWHSPEYYAFFAQHGGVVAAALGLVFGLRLQPQPGAFRRVMLWSWVYMAVTFPLNCLLKTNYGYLNGKPDFPTLLDHAGPWPWYLLTLQALAFLFFGLLLLPFQRKGRREN